MTISTSSSIAAAGGAIAEEHGDTSSVVAEVAVCSRRRRRRLDEMSVNKGRFGGTKARIAQARVAHVPRGFFRGRAHYTWLFVKGEVARHTYSKVALRTTHHTWMADPLERTPARFRGDGA